MIKKSTYKIPLYGGKLIVLLCDGLYEVPDYLNVQFTEYIPADGAFFVVDENFYIAIKRNCGVGVIAHECKHFVNRLFSCRGVGLDTENDEPECYLLAWGVNKVCATIYKDQDK